jgi:hypothetical protein
VGGGLAGEVASAMDPQPGAFAGAAAGDGDVDDHRGAGAQLPQRRRRGMAEDPVRTGREHRGHPSPARGQDGVAERIHTVMDAAEPSCRDAVGDRGVAEAELAQLTTRDYAVLACRERRDRHVHAGWCGFFRHSSHLPHHREACRKNRYSGRAERTNSAPDRRQNTPARSLTPRCS